MGSAKNRYGDEFTENEDVFIKQGYHKAVEGRVFVVDEIFPFDACESGFMIQLVDKETGSLLKRKLDTNWISKIKNKN